MKKKIIKRNNFASTDSGTISRCIPDTQKPARTILNEGEDASVENERH